MSLGILLLVLGTGLAIAATAAFLTAKINYHRRLKRVNKVLDDFLARKDV